MNDFLLLLSLYGLILFGMNPQTFDPWNCIPFSSHWTPLYYPDFILIKAIFFPIEVLNLSA